MRSPRQFQHTATTLGIGYRSGMNGRLADEAVRPIDTWRGRAGLRATDYQRLVVERLVSY